MTTQSIPGVVFEARAREGMQRGVNQLVNAVRPTLGPCPRVVAVEHTFRHRTPELLDNAGVITRRIIELPDRDADVGAMLLRNMLWRVHEEAGDGTATAAILFQAVYNRTKAFIDSFAYALRNELKDTNVSVTVLMPGPTDTEFFERAELTDTKVGTQRKQAPEEVARTGYEAMEDGESAVVAGWKNKLQAVLANVTPAEVLAEQHRRMAEPGEA